MRESIKKLIAENERRIESIPGTHYHSDIDIALGDREWCVLQSQNSELQAILDAHK